MEKADISFGYRRLLLATARESGGVDGAGEAGGMTLTSHYDGAVSSIVTYFVASGDDSAVQAIADWPAKDLPQVVYGNFDAYTAMVEWLTIGAGGSDDDALDDEEPRILGEHDAEDESLVYAAPAALQQLLSAAEPSRLEEIGELWAQELIDAGEGIDIKLVQEILTEVANLARIAQARDQVLYCWMS